LWSRLR